MEESAVFRKEVEISERMYLYCYKLNIIKSDSKFIQVLQLLRPYTLLFLVLVPLLLDDNAAIMIEVVRVFGNLTRSKTVRDLLVRNKGKLINSIFMCMWSDLSK